MEVRISRICSQATSTLSMAIRLQSLPKTKCKSHLRWCSSRPTTTSLALQAKHLEWAHLEETTTLSRIKMSTKISQARKRIPWLMTSAALSPRANLHRMMLWKRWSSSDLGRCKTRSRLSRTRWVSWRAPTWTGTTPLAATSLTSTSENLSSNEVLCDHLLFGPPLFIN